jgi:phosphoglycolate phosphatase-like HAD superfamily hydrolase
MRRLVLWDIDGTLVRVGPAGRNAIESGAARVAGLTEVPFVQMGGKTDPQIVREIFTLAQLAEHHIEDLLPRAIAEVEAALAAEEESIRRDGRVMPGVGALLERLAATEGVRQTVLTGNVVANAAVKLAAFGLERFLDVEAGAYGSDDADRTRLVPIARERVGRLRGEQYLPGEVWVIGDTAHDLACARAAGARCLVVGTGFDGYDAVRDLPADAILEDLSDTDRVVKILTVD